MDIRTALRTRLDTSLPIVFRNDAEAAIVGEAQYGAGRGYSRVIGLTLGTGLGSCHLLDGMVQQSGAGVPVEGWLGAVPYQDGIADDWFSTRGLMRRFQLSAQDVIDLPSIAVRGRDGDQAIRNVFAQFGVDLEIFLQPYVRDFAAEVVLLAGGISSTLDLFGSSATSQLDIPMLMGTLGNHAALRGAAQLLFAE